jgi:2,4-dienoyl-CoA reductase-like NADH-dependent reductase (Old Yellow Enzyme family)
MDLFEPFKIRNLELKNRFVRSATGDGTADDSGRVTDKSVAIYEALGKGGVGLIITGHVFISPEGQASANQYGIHNDAMIPSLARLVKTAHAGGAKIAIQISHAGVNSKFAFPQGTMMQAVSDVPDLVSPYHVMNDAEIRSTVSAFAEAARRAVAAGFDAIQIHGAHGYLLSQFLSPLNNRRHDKWGGSARKRRAFHLEVLKEVRKAVGPDYPLLIKLGVLDEKEGGLKLEEGVETAREVAAHGIDAIEVSVGVGTSIKPARADAPEDAYFRAQAAAVKKAVSVPVMVVGGIRSLNTARYIVATGEADLISMCRPFMREPDIIARWQRGLKSQAACISCNKCMTARADGRRLQCVET